MPRKREVNLSSAVVVVFTLINYTPFTVTMNEAHCNNFPYVSLSRFFFCSSVGKKERENLPLWLFSMTMA